MINGMNGEIMIISRKAVAINEKSVGIKSSMKLYDYYENPLVGTCRNLNMYANTFKIWRYQYL